MIKTRQSEPAASLERLQRFLHRPFLEKAIFVKKRCRLFLSNIPIPIRLPFGAWWLARNDYPGNAIRRGQFENAEYAFVNRFLQPGMTVLDIGAHHGFYTLLASKRVGSQGRVFAFEPSPRERKALLLHRRLNRAKNVAVEALAVGGENANADFFVVQGMQTGCNSLRPPAVDVRGALRPLPVRVVRLDTWLEENCIGRVDFVKLDVEGAELQVLEGATSLLAHQPRPIFMVEVQDIRTQPWGYSAREIVVYLASNGFKWLDLLADGTCASLQPDRSPFDGNYVACPEEREREVRQLASA